MQYLNLDGAQGIGEPSMSSVATMSKSVRKRRLGSGFDLKKLWGPTCKKIVGIGLILLAIVLFFGYFFVFVPASNVYAQVRVVRQELAILQEHARTQNVNGIRAQLPIVKAAAVEMKKRGQGLGWTRFVPFIGAYYGDFEHGMIAVDAGLSAGEKMVEIFLPYADLLGLSGSAAQGSTLDRIARIVDTLDKVVPELNKIEPELKKVKTAVNKINPDRYWFNKSIQEGLKSAIVQINDFEAILKDARPFLEALPKFLGKDQPSKYVVLFLNDKELRAGGGFISAYALLTLDKGRVISSNSADIYKIDERLPIRLEPPAQIQKYLPEPNGAVKTHWQTRDSNVYPDFKANAEIFEYMFQHVQPVDWDGVIAVDTHVVEAIVRVLGKVEVNGITFTAENDPRCECPQVVYVLSSTARGGVGGNVERKALIGDLMQALLVNSFKDEKKLPQLVAETVRLLGEKHVQLYMHDDGLQYAVEHMGWAGRVASADNPTRFGYVEGKWDYFLWSEANYAGEKANLYVEPGQQHGYSVAGDGTIIKNIKFTNRNPRQKDDFLNAPYRGYFRVYVPKGSQLTRSSGGRDKIQSGEAFGKTYFEGFYELKPGGAAETIELEYRLPFKYDNKDGLRALYQKQAGVPGYTYKISGVFGNKSFELTRDETLVLRK
jgi:hypothetical protein